MPDNRALPPQPTGGRPCAWNDGRAAVGWRWSRAMTQWLAVCGQHRGGKRVMSSAEFVPDFANVERAEPQS